MKPGNDILTGMNDVVLETYEMISEDEKTALMGGHFILDADGNCDNTIMGVFTQYTKLMVESVMSANPENTYAFTMVNDWSKLRSNGNKGTSVREKFWFNATKQSFFNIPKDKLMSGYGTHGHNNNLGLISEKYLQNQFNSARRKVKGHDNYELLQIDREIHSNPVCATEVLMMLDIISREYTQFIGFMPSFCMDAIESAVSMFSDSTLRKELLNNDTEDFDIIRIYFNSIQPSNFSDFMEGHCVISSDLNE